MGDEGIPISNLDTEEGHPFLDEVSETELDEEVEVISELSEDIGGYNELPLIEDIIKTSFDLGNTYIILLSTRDDPFIATVTEIIIADNLLKMEDDMNKILSFQFENSEIIMKTNDYDILDIIKVIPHEPEKEEII